MTVQDELVNFIVQNETANSRFLAIPHHLVVADLFVPIIEKNGKQALMMRKASSVMHYSNGEITGLPHRPDLPDDVLQPGDFYVVVAFTTKQMAIEMMDQAITDGLFTKRMKVIRKPMLDYLRDMPELDAGIVIHNPSTKYKTLMLPPTRILKYRHYAHEIDPFFIPVEFDFEFVRSLEHYQTEFDAELERRIIEIVGNFLWVNDLKVYGVSSIDLGSSVPELVPIVDVTSKEKVSVQVYHQRMYELQRELSYLLPTLGVVLDVPIFRNTFKLPPPTTQPFTLPVIDISPN